VACIVSWIAANLLETTERQQIEVLHEIHETTRCGNENIAAHLQLFALITSRSTTVDDARAQHSAVAESTSLVEDLAGQLSSRADDEHKRLSADAVCEGVVPSGIRTRGRELAGLAHELRQDREEEGSCLSRSW
jgi:hypothetical protein